MLIVNAKVSDLKKIKKILKSKELGWDDKDNTNYFKRLINDEKGIFLVAKNKFKILGFVYGEYNKEENWAELAGIAIAKRHRRKGIGFILIKEFEKMIQSQDIDCIEIFAHINTLGRHIHKLGYELGNIYINCRKRL